VSRRVVTANQDVDPVGVPCQEHGGLAGRIRTPQHNGVPAGHPLGLELAQSDSGKWWVREHAVGHQTIVRGAIHAGEIVPDDAEIVERHVRELWTASAFANCPAVRRTRFEPFVDLDVTALVQRDSGDLEPDRGGIRSTSGRDQDVAALDGLFARSRTNAEGNVMPGAAFDSERLG